MVTKNCVAMEQGWSPGVYIGFALMLFFSIGCSDNLVESDALNNGDSSSQQDANEDAGSADTLGDDGSRDTSSPDGSRDQSDFHGDCPAVATSCPDGCYEMRASKVDVENQCREGRQVIGCQASSIETSDVVCLKSKDTDGFYFGASSYHRSDVWAECDPEQAPEQSEFPPCDE